MALMLVVADDAAVSARIATIVRRLGHEAFIASSCGEALVQAATRNFSVVMLSVELPDGNGLELLPQLRQNYLCPEIIIMARAVRGDEAEQAIKSGAWDYIEHPSTKDTLTLTLTRALQYQEEKRNLGVPIALKRERIVGSSAEIRESLDLVAQAAGCQANVLITGETGTGKELYAAAIHENSTRAAGNFVVVDCSALPANIVESVLFGHEKGAYTGADRTHEGLAAQAHRGTLFLDEVGELPRNVQNSFLRVVQERRYRPVGASREVHSDFRLIAATNRDLDAMAERGEFRADLLYRLRTIILPLPPLRQHKEDIKALALHYVAKTCDQYGLEMKGFVPEFFSVLAAYDWPGNVRELSQALERSVASAGSRPLLFPRDLPTDIRARLARASADTLNPPEITDAESAEDPARTLPPLDVARATAIAAAEQDYLRELLADTAGDMARACAVSGLSRSRLYSLLKKHRIPRPGSPHR
jgi:two-component system, NtrC family, response regulator